MTYDDLVIQEQAAELKRVKTELSLAHSFISWQGLESAWAAWIDAAKSNKPEAVSGVRT